jgi:hypothetical protein
LLYKIESCNALSATISSKISGVCTSILPDLFLYSLSSIFCGFSTIFYNEILKLLNVFVKSCFPNLIGRVLPWKLTFPQSLIRYPYARSRLINLRDLPTELYYITGGPARHERVAPNTGCGETLFGYGHVTSQILGYSVICR